MRSGWCGLSKLEWFRVRWSLLVGASAMLALLGMLGCGRTTRPSPGESALVADDVLRPYPPGNWRLARHELHRVLLTVSHILIAHRDSQSGEHSELRAPNWSAERRTPRTREQAQALAATVAQEARLAPGQFAKLAEEYSDDLASSERGGSLGTWSAADLPPSFLDAINMMQFGETSRVVETALGFHVLYLRAPPDHAKVEARRVLISYTSTAPFLQRSDTPIERTREEAELLAKQVAAEAADHPERFRELVERYSEHADALRGGDFGLWSNHERSRRQREIEAIGALEVGHVSEPIDGEDGFSIFLRTAATDRPDLAVTYLLVQGDSQPVTSAAGKRKSPRLPADVRPLLSGRSRGFETLQAKYCCDVVDRWQQGRGDPRIEHLIISLPTGAVSSHPIEVGPAIFKFCKRVRPPPPPMTEAVTLELPSPTRPDVDSLVSQARRGEDISAFVTALRHTFGDGLGVHLDADRHKHVSEILDRFTQDVRSQGVEGRIAALNEARSRFKDVLSEREFAALQANIRSELTRALMGPH